MIDNTKCLRTGWVGIAKRSQILRILGQFFSNMRFESFKVVFLMFLFKITKLEHLRSDALYLFAVKIQSVVRGFLARQYYRKLKERIRGNREYSLVQLRWLYSYEGNQGNGLET